jgi:hypothetical protein
MKLHPVSIGLFTTLGLPKVIGILRVKSAVLNLKIGNVKVNHPRLHTLDYH